MAERTSKLCTLSELVSRIPDGSRVAFGGFAVYQKPMSAVRELIRQGKKHLTIVGTVHSLDVDMLVGAGCVDRVETSYVGLERYGLAPNFRRAVQEGRIELVSYPEMLAWDRFRADREGWPFWPCYSLGGNDAILGNPDIKEYTCPVTGRRAWALPAAKPDVVVIHGYQGDKYGNVRLQGHSMLPQAMDVEMARSCSTVLVTLEELIDNAEIRKTPELTQIPAMRVSGVTPVVHGSHPLSTLLKCREDEAHMRLYAEAAKTPEGFREYLDRYVYSTADEQQYRQVIGEEQLAGLEEEE